MNAWERQTIAHMERELSGEGWQKRIGVAVMLSACAGGFVAFILFAIWLTLAWLGVL